MSCIKITQIAGQDQMFGNCWSSELHSETLVAPILVIIHNKRFLVNPDSKVHGANMEPTWDLSALDGPPCWPHEPCYRM